MKFATDMLPFETCLEDQTPGQSKIQRTEYLDAGSLPVIDQGQKPIAGFTNNEQDAYNGSLPVILFGDHTLAIKYVDHPFALGADGVRVLAAKRPFVPKFLYYYLRSVKIPSRGYSRHFKYLRELRFPHVAESEQNRIVELLEQADALRQKRAEADALADRILPSFFNKLFGDPISNPKNWPTKALGTVCEISRGASPRPIADYMGGTVPWIKISDGSTGGPYLTATAEFVTKEGAAKSVFVPPGSLIVANSGVSCGFARILKIGGCIHDGWLALLRITPEVQPLYLLAFINLMTLELRRRAPGGTQPNLNTGLMKSVLLPMPPAPLQELFAKAFEQSQIIIAKQVTATSCVESLFSTMLHRAFTGELTAKWRKAHLKELLAEMEQQAKLLNLKGEQP